MGSAAEQFRKLWSELGLNQRVTIILSLLGVLAVMIAILVWSSQPRMAVLASGLEGSDMAAVIEIAEKAGVEPEVRGRSIYVPADKADKLRVQVAAEGVMTGGSIGFELFDETGFGQSDLVQRTNLTRARQGELERMIEAVQGVNNARVMIVIPENKLILDPDKPKATAAVQVDTGGRVLENGQIVAIRNLVAHAIPGLQSSRVSVMDNKGNDLSARVSEDGALALAASQLKQQRAIEDARRKELETMLTPVVGKGNVIARVNVTLDHKSSRKSSRTFDPSSQVARTEEKQKRSQKSTEVETDPIVGVEPNVPAGLDGEIASKPLKANSESAEQKTKTAFEISEENLVVEEKPGRITKVSAAILINRRPPVAAEGAGGGGEPTSTPRTAEEMAEIKLLVANALGVDISTPAGASLITVQEREFFKDEPVGPSLVDKVDEWVQILKPWVVVLIALVLFFIFLSMLKRHKPAMTPVEVLDDEDETALANANVSPRPTPELLNELIQEKPENVAQALKSWSAIK